MPLVKAVQVKISVDGIESAKLAIDKITVKADELKRLNPTIDIKIDKAKALLQAKLLRDGIKAELAGSLDIGAGGGGGILSKILGTTGNGGDAASGLLGQLSSVPWPAIAAGAAAVAALLPELTGVVSGLAAAGAGVGAFGLLALPTFKKIETAYTGITAAQQKYNAAVALNKADPTKTHAKDTAAALVALKLAEDNLSPSTKTAVGGIQSLIGTYENMAKAFAPDAMKVFNGALKIANTLLPDLKLFATAASGAIDGLLKRVNTFFASADFRKWLSSFEKLVGPSIGAIGKGIGQLTIQVGKLLTTFSAKDTVNAIHIAFAVIGGAIEGVRGIVIGLMKTWDVFERTFLVDARLIVDGAAKAFGWIPGLGPKLRAASGAFDNWAAGIEGRLHGIQGTAASTAAMLAGVANAAINAMNKAAPISGISTGGAPRRRAAGGPASGLTLVGEQGPELVMTPPGSYVYNHQRTTQMMGGGDVHYHINIGVMPGSEREAGRVIVERIKAFEQGSGMSWRK